MSKTMRLLKILAASALVAGGVAFAHYSPSLAHLGAERISGRLAAGEGALELAAGGIHPFDSSARSESSDPFQLRILSKVAYYVGEDYVDQSRVDPNKMLKSSMDALQRGIAEIQVEYTGESMKVHVGAQDRTFPAKVKDLDEMVVRLKEVFAFFKETLPEQPEPQDLEYAAIGGMLSTLDPHSVLLPPEVYDEMKLSTSGEFGGLGIVIAIRDAALTVISPLDDTPASKAGIKSGDKIVRIGEESTVNMNLEEAVKKLRGPKGTAVTIAVLRKGIPDAKEYTLVRDTIKIVNVEGQLLSGDIGYVRVKGFQEDTGSDVEKQMKTMAAKAPGGKLKGIVLDLRNNPGGLLDEAIKLSDVFLESGPIVTTVGVGNKLRDEKDAKWPGTDGGTPVIVLTNGGSASASEIVAGALKNRDRAVVLGEQTFGKGSVQNLFDLRDGSALKLTIAKYLPPGDISIQSVGVTPDIETTPVKIAADHVDLTGESRKFRETDLGGHFDNDGSGIARKDKPALTLRFLDSDDAKPKGKYTPLSPKEGQEKDKNGATPAPKDNKSDKNAAKKDPSAPKDESGAEPEDEIDPEYRKTADLTKDFEVQLAMSVLKGAGNASRKKMLAAAPSVIAKASGEQDTRIIEEFRKLGIDWSVGKDNGQPKIAAAVEFSPSEHGAGQQTVSAGDELKITVNVTNKGTSDITRLQGTSKSDEPLFDGIEFAFGRVKPGQTKSFTIPMKVPKAWPASVTEMGVELARIDEPTLQTVPSKLAVKPLPHPSFAYSWQILDGSGANGDGIAHRGDTVEMRVNVTNLGPGDAPDPVAMLKNLEGEGVFIDRGRIKFDPLAVGKSGEGKFRFQVKEGFAKANFDLRLTVADAMFGDYVSEKIQLPTGPKGEAISAASGSVQLTIAALVYSGASEKTLVLAKANKGAILAQKGRLKEWTEVALPDGRTGWLAPQKATTISRAPSAEGIDNVRMSPPKLTVSPNKDQLVMKGERTSVQGTATDDIGMKDMWIMVNDKKVFYRTFPADAPARDPVSFMTDLPLEKGQNRVVIIARDKNDLESTSTFSIRREVEADAKATGKSQTRVQ